MYVKSEFSIHLLSHSMRLIRIEVIKNNFHSVLFESVLSNRRSISRTALRELCIRLDNDEATSASLIARFV